MHTLVLERDRAKRDLPVPKARARWRCIGPTNIGGRLTSIVCHPKHPDRIWVGAAGGGVWQSKDAGQTWRSLWNKQDSLNIGSLAIDPKNPNVIYCGTGEANLSLDSYGGVGIYKTTDGGATWKPLARASDLGIPTRIGVIAVDPFDSAHLLIGGVGADESSPRRDDFGGMFVSRDRGVTWTAVFVLRRTRPDAPRPSRAWGHPWMTGCFIAGCLGLAAVSLVEAPARSLLGLGLIAAGLPAYAWWSRKAPPGR